MENSILVFWSSLLYSIQHDCIICIQLYMLVFFSSYLYSMSLHNMRCWSSVILYPSVHPPHPFSSCWRGHNITFFSWTRGNNFWRSSSFCTMPFKCPSMPFEIDFLYDMILKGMPFQIIHVYLKGHALQ